MSSTSAALVFPCGTPAPDEAAAGDKESAGLSGLADWYAIVPISNSRAPGEYSVAVKAGETIYETIVTVTEYEFDFQDMIIDTSVPSVAAATTNAAIAEFREKVSPLVPLISEEIYWSDLFIMPVELGEEGFISTEFGEIRITNSNPNTRRSHLGMDLAVKTGTPVYASGAGKVLLAEFLYNTGNTVIIDHGGGLKSFYYHMDSVDTVAGKIVERGELIGTVGSTGYSTGPHLHFEMRIGEQPVSPSMLFDRSAGLYSAALFGRPSVD
jgi:murein DD-endopeptidase MepM/ murein hydrolase activator NlpD